MYILHYMGGGGWSCNYAGLYTTPLFLHLEQIDHTPGRGILLCNENGIGSNFLERGGGVGGDALRLTGKYFLRHNIHLGIGFSLSDNRMWQSRVKIKDYSILYFDHIAMYKASYC